jgi:hypothetical protein
MAQRRKLTAFVLALVVVLPDMQAICGGWFTGWDEEGENEVG